MKGPLYLLLGFAIDGLLLRQDSKLSTEQKLMFGLAKTITVGMVYYCRLKLLVVILENFHHSVIFLLKLSIFATFLITNVITFMLLFSALLLQRSCSWPAVSLMRCVLWKVTHLK